MADKRKPAEFIKKFEGYSPKPYSDFGQTSIGYGTKAKPEDQEITEPEATKRLDEHVAGTEALIDRVVKVPLSPAQREALVDYQYNTGDLQGSKVLDRVNKGDFVGAAKEMDIVTAGGKPLKGLKDRRQAERERMVPAPNGPEPKTLADLTADLEAKWRKKHGAK